MNLEGFSAHSDIVRSGVYILCSKGVVLYVGKAKCMLSRINAHKNAWVAKRKGRDGWISDRLGIPGLLFDEVHIKPTPLHLLDKVERETIDRFRPKYNIMLRPNGVIKAPINLTINGVVLGMNAKPQGEPIARRF